jgi:hypothetical protein
VYVVCLHSSLSRAALAFPTHNPLNNAKLEDTSFTERRTYPSASWLLLLETPTDFYPHQLLA